jgi:hypothetical protein
MTDHHVTDSGNYGDAVDRAEADAGYMDKLADDVAAEVTGITEDDTEPVDHAERSESMARYSLGRCEAQLADLRRRRDELADQIRGLVTQQETLAQAVAVYDRRRRS